MNHLARDIRCSKVRIWNSALLNSFLQLNCRNASLHSSQRVKPTSSEVGFVVLVSERGPSCFSPCGIRKIGDALSSKPPITRRQRETPAAGAKNIKTETKISVLFYFIFLPSRARTIFRQAHLGRMRYPG